MSTATVTPIRAATKRPARTRKAAAAGPNVSLLSEAATLITFACRVYDQADSADLHSQVRVARAQIERWCAENPDVDLSHELFNGLGLLIMADMAFWADLKYSSSICDPYRNILNAAAEFLGRAADKPTDD